MSRRVIIQRAQAELCESRRCCGLICRDFHLLRSTINNEDVWNRGLTFKKDVASRGWLERHRLVGSFLSSDMPTPGRRVQPAFSLKRDGLQPSAASSSEPSSTRVSAQVRPRSLLAIP